MLIGSRNPALWDIKKMTCMFQNKLKEGGYIRPWPCPFALLSFLLLTEFLPSKSMASKLSGVECGEGGEGSSSYSFLPCTLVEVTSIVMHSCCALCWPSDGAYQSSHGISKWNKETSVSLLLSFPGKWHLRFSFWPCDHSPQKQLQCYLFSFLWIC